MGTESDVLDILPFHRRSASATLARKGEIFYPIRGLTGFRGLTGGNKDLILPS